MKHRVDPLTIVVLVLALWFGVPGIGNCGPVAGLAADGLGWGGITLGMSYDEVKASLKEKGFTIDTTLGMHHTEDYVYNRTFAASSGKPGKDRLVYTITGDMWEKKIYSLKVELEGADSEALLAQLTRIFGGTGERSGEDNHSWEKGNVRVMAFLPKGSARLEFSDTRVVEKIAKQSRIDQGLVPGMKTPPSPEVIFYNTRQKAFAEALPPVPDGWETDEETRLGRTIRQITQYTDRPMKIEYGRTYINRALEAQFERKQAAMLEPKRAGMEAGQAAMEKKIAALQPKIDALGEKLRAAAEAGNFREVERLQKELETLQAGLVGEAESVLPSEDAPEFKIPDGFDSRCRILVQSYDLYAQAGNHPGDWTQGPPLEGGIPVFIEEMERDPRQYVRSTLSAFVGPVQCKLSGKKLTVSRPDLKQVPHIGIACICVTVSAGTADRARRTLERVDWQSLRSLVTRMESGK